MSRGKTLGACLTSLRTELRLSLNPAHNVQVRDTHVAVLQRVQEWLWDNYSWPHLRVERYLQPEIGQRFYDPAGCLKIDQNTGLLVAAGDVAIDRIVYFNVRDGSTWGPPMLASIPVEVFNQWDSDGTQKAWPPRRWQIAENNNVEFWPVPDQNGNTTTLENMIRFTGTRNLATFTLDADTADLDDQALISFAAAKLTPAGKERNDFLAQGQQRMRDIRANVNPRRRVRVFGNQRPERLLRGPPTVYYRTS